MVEFIKGILYSCECGYKTINNNLACKHSKTLKCKGNNMKKRDVNFVLEEDYTSLMNKCNTGNQGVVTIGDHASNVSVSNIIIINLTVPDKSVVSSVYDAVKNPDCVQAASCGAHHNNSVSRSYTPVFGARNPHNGLFGWNIPPQGSCQSVVFQRTGHCQSFPGV